MAKCARISFSIDGKTDTRNCPFIISKETGIPEKQIAEAMDAISEPLSLYDTVFHDDNDTMLIMDQIQDGSSDDKILEKTALKQALNATSVFPKPTSPHTSLSIIF